MSRHAVSKNGYGICGELLRTSPQLPQPRRRLNGINNVYPDHSESKTPFPAEHYLLDTRLLMGGTNANGLITVQGRSRSRDPGLKNSRPCTKSRSRRSSSVRP